MDASRFFIGAVAGVDLIELFDIVNCSTYLRITNDKDKIGVKLPLGDTNNYPILDTFTEHDCESYIEETSKAEWQTNG